MHIILCMLSLKRNEPSWLSPPPDEHISACVWRGWSPSSLWDRTAVGTPHWDCSTRPKHISRCGSLRQLLYVIMGLRAKFCQFFKHFVICSSFWTSVNSSTSVKLSIDTKKRKMWAFRSCISRKKSIYLAACWVKMTDVKLTVNIDLQNDN